MERWQADIEVDAILITDAKADYILSAHGVTRQQVWSVFGLAPRYFADGRGRYSMIGPNGEGRYLIVGLMPTDEQGTWRLITAYWLRPGRGQRLYGGDK